MGLAEVWEYRLPDITCIRSAWTVSKCYQVGLPHELGSGELQRTIKYYPDGGISFEDRVGKRLVPLLFVSSWPGTR